MLSHVCVDGERAAKKALSGSGGSSCGRLPTAIVLDIEGTIASIAYVTDTLFPYARQRLRWVDCKMHIALLVHDQVQDVQCDVGCRDHLNASYDSTETQDDLALLRRQAQSDASSGTVVPAIADAIEGREKVIATAVANCEAQMDADRKTTALKSLQGHIWAGGFERGELKGELYADVPDALAQWRAAGIKTYIYSSGSRSAQKDLLGSTTVGDLRPYLSGFFDTTSGSKVS